MRLFQYLLAIVVCSGFAFSASNFEVKELTSLLTSNSQNAEEQNVGPKDLVFENTTVENRFGKFLSEESNHLRRILKAFYLYKVENNYDSCISEREYNLYESLWEHWDNQPETATRRQLTRHVVYNYTPDKKSAENRALRGIMAAAVDKNEALFHSSRIWFHREWRDEEGYLRIDGLKKYLDHWQMIDGLDSSEVDAYISREILKTSSGCTPVKVSLEDSQTFDPMERAIEVGEYVLKNEKLNNFALWWGNTGVALFLGELYGYTKDKRYLERASLLMNDVEANYDVSKAGAGGLILGDAGIAQTYLSLYLASGEERFLIRAKFWADSIQLINEATEHAFGAAGVGIVYLNFYYSTGERKWLNKAIEMAEFLDERKLTLPGYDGYTWYMTTKSPTTFAGFGHGSAGMGYFLLKLYEITGDQKLMETALKVGDFTLSTAYEDKDGGLHWTWYQPMSYSFDFKHFWSHGSPSMLILYNELLRHTDDVKWKTAMEKSLQATFKEAVDAGGKALISECCGRQSLAQIMLLIHERTGEKKWYDYAEKFTGLVFDEDGKLPLVKDTGEKIGIGFDEMSGLGLMFLRLHDPDRARHPFYVFPGN